MEAQRRAEPAAKVGYKKKPKCNGRRKTFVKTPVKKFVKHVNTKSSSEAVL